MIKTSSKINRTTFNRLQVNRPSIKRQINPVNFEKIKNTNNPRKSKKKKTIKIIAKILTFLIIIAITGFLIWKLFFNENGNSGINKTEDTGLIGQYKNQLPDLKKKANESDKPEDLQNYAIAQYATGDTGGAVKTYEKLAQKNPNNPSAHSGLANALRDEKKFDQAIEEYEKVIELSPTNISAYVNLASVYQYSLKKVDKAIEIYQSGINNNPKSIDLYLLLGIANEQANDKDNAKKAYEKAIEINENNIVAKNALERLSR